MRTRYSIYAHVLFGTLPARPDGRQNGPLVPSARTQTHTHEDTRNTCKAQSPCLQPSLVQLTGKLIAPIEARARTSNGAAEILSKIKRERAALDKAGAA